MDASVKDLAFQSFDEIWVDLRLQSHIVTGLSKHKNSKQALDVAEHFKRVVKQEIIDDVQDWYALKSVFKDLNGDVKYDVMTRINGELAKLGLGVFIE